MDTSFNQFAESCGRDCSHYAADLPNIFRRRMTIFRKSDAARLRRCVLFFERVAVARCIARHRFRVTEYMVRYKFFISSKPPFSFRNSLHAGVNILRPSIARHRARLRETRF